MATFRYRSGVASIALAVASIAAPAYAQETPPAAQSDATEAPATSDALATQSGATEADAAQGGEVVVTGSRIARRDYVAQSPIVTTSRAAIENAGVPTVDAALLQLPQFQPGAGGFTNQSQGGLGVGQATLNLRGLQPVRTLVLLDGRRLQPGNAQNVIDTNTLPSSAIGGVEVISGGASATYGSDAVAGVVNFKLRNRFEGLELNSQIGISELGDAANQQVSFIAGTRFADRKGSIMIAGEYANRDAVGYRARDFSSTLGTLATATASGYYAPAGTNLPTQAAVNTVFGTYGVAAGTVGRTQNIGVNADGTLFRSALPATNYKSAGDPCVANEATRFGYDGFCTNNLQTALRRYSFLGRGEYEAAPDVTLFVQGTYANNLARGQGSHPTIAPFGASGLTVPITNPFIPADLRAVLASRTTPTASFTYVKRFQDGGPRSYTSETDTFQVVAGARGVLPGTSWNFEIYGSHGETSATDKTVAGSVSISALQRLLNAADGGASLCQGGYNIFGPTPTSASCLAYISRNTTSRTTIKQDEVAGNLSGSLFALPAGDVKVALSANARRNSYRVDPDAALQAGDIAAVVATQPTRGQTTVGEAAIELLIPILADKPLFQSLNLTPGYRFSHYSPGGSISTYKLSFDWRLAQPLLLRGGYQRAVRAPNIGELFLAPSAVLVNIGQAPTSGDPCDVRSAYRTGANGAAVRTLCIAQGVPSTIVDTYNQVGGGIGAVVAGNRGLQPEKADTWTIGGVFQPTFLGGAFRRMSLSVDYYNIRIDDVITSLDVPTSIAKCFNGDGSNSTYDASNFYCGNITRNPANGQIVAAQQTILNIGGYRTDGIDAQLDWALPLELLGAGSSAGSLNLNFTVNWLNRFEISQVPGAPFQDFAGTIGPSTQPGAIQSFAKWKTAGTVTYDIDAFQIGVRWRHFGSFRDISVVTNPASTIPGTRATDYFDLIGRIRATDDFEFRAGITNLTNRQPQVVGGVAGVTNLGIYDPIGRAFYIGARAKF